MCRVWVSHRYPSCSSANVNLFIFNIVPKVKSLFWATGRKYRTWFSLSAFRALLHLALVVNL